MSPGSDGSRTTRAMPLAFPAHPGMPSRVSPDLRAVLAISVLFSQVSIGGNSPEKQKGGTSSESASRVDFLSEIIFVMVSGFCRN